MTLTQKAFDDIRAKLNANLVVVAHEMKDYKESGILRDGIVRECATKLNGIVEYHSQALRIVESIVFELLIDQVLKGL